MSYQQDYCVCAPDRTPTLQIAEIGLGKNAMPDTYLVAIADQHTGLAMSGRGCLKLSLLAVSFVYDCWPARCD